MPTEQTFELAGQTWTVHPLDLDEQFEVEVILLRALAPAAGHALGALIEDVAPPLVEVLRETAGQGASFDLAKLATLDTTDPRFSLGWSKLLDGLGTAAGDVVRGFTMALSRVNHQDLVRLGELILLRGGKLLVHLNGKPQVVDSWPTIGKLIARDPSAKWQLLIRGFEVTYSKPKPPEEPAEPETTFEVKG